MEKIKVNMNPNPLDVQTIHASQNDGEARQWEFELHNNGELIDTSNVTEQLFFKSYKGGTEQILPENTSTPTTSPFIGDIRYPQGLLTDQEFTYRESPTESDGLAKITDIKGNTLVWNQIYNVNNDRTTFGVNIKVVNGAVSITGTSTSTGSGPAFAWTDFKGVVGHKYIITKDFALPSGDYIFDQYNLNSSTDITTVVFTLNNSGEYMIPQLRIAQSGVTYNISGHLCVYDLTKMFGQGNEPTSVEEFKSLFSLPYYAYNQGTLLSFNGNGIKTVGKNLIEPSFVDNTIQGVSYKYNEDGSITCSGHSTANTSQFALQPERSTSIVRGAYYFLSGGNDQIRLRITTFDSSGTVRHRNNTSTSTGNMRMMFDDDEVAYNVTAFPASVDIDIDCTVYPQFEISYEKTEREPYTESTLSLPISTYFPNGMKSAGNVYDELTESKAITRVGQVDLGTLNWEILGTVGVSHLFLARTGVNSANDNIQQCDRNIKISSSKYTPVASWNNISMDKSNMAYGVYGTQVRISDSNYTTIETFKASLSGVYLNYELATPTETSFTTASLVTENTEIPLSNEDGTLIGKCTEELSAEPGFHDAKIKLADSDGECYSNKLQLHVERSPQ